MRLLDFIRENRAKWQRYADTLADAGYGQDSIRSAVEDQLESLVPVLAERADEALDWDRIKNDQIREWLEERDGKVIAALLDLIVSAALSKISRTARERGTTRHAVRLRLTAGPLRRQLGAGIDLPRGRAPIKMVVGEKTPGGDS